MTSDKKSKKIKNKKGNAKNKKKKKKRGLTHLIMISLCHSQSHFRGSSNRIKKIKTFFFPFGSN